MERLPPHSDTFTDVADTLAKLRQLPVVGAMLWAIVRFGLVLFLDACLAAMKSRHFFAMTSLRIRYFFLQYPQCGLARLFVHKNPHPPVDTPEA